MEDVSLKLLLPKGAHLGDPIDMIWPEAASPTCSYVFEEDGARIRFEKRRFRPKDLQHTFPGGDLIVTTEDRVADVLSKTYDFDPNDIGRLRELLAENGFEYLEALGYNPCFVAALTKGNMPDWRTNSGKTHTEFPYLQYREVQRGSSRPRIIRIGNDAPRSIGRRNGEQPQEVRIVPVSGGAEDYCRDDSDPYSKAVTVVQRGESLTERRLHMQELLVASEPFVAVRREIRERFPRTVEEIRSIIQEKKHMGERMYSHLFEPPGVTTNPDYRDQVSAFGARAYRPDDPASAARLERFGIPMPMQPVDYRSSGNRVSGLCAV